ncbi:vitamin K epoxide reductase family protein [Pedobacter duraquae]|uniref:Putative membrane protein n=1 Tax=Pedobacter duraquae TaxID=425511 RepID=A0A4V3C3K1_9SPHI|nr:vitamin K epoxide reductase family protein [Pedobacter duraquae]TDO22358.1 putative membrane protein [Pedobacter duraquae]
MKSNISYVLQHLVNVLKVKVTTSTILAEVHGHPNFPSISTISYVLDKWKMPNGAYKVNTADLSEIPCPFIAQLYSRNGEFVLVQSVSSEHIAVSNDQYVHHSFTIQEFDEMFSGNILLAQSDEYSGEAAFAKKVLLQRIQTLKLPFFISSIICFLIFQIGGDRDVHFSYLALIVLKSMGLIISCILLLHQIDSKNPWIKKVCAQNDVIDCDTILTSKASRVFDFLSWSEVGFFYFAGSCLLLIFPKGENINRILFWLTLFCLPYTFYSIYFQALIARKWCVFCCAIQLIFWLEFVAMCTTDLFQPFAPNISSLVYAMAIFSLPISFWIVFKPILIASTELPAIKMQMIQSKYDDDYFWHLISKQAKYGLLSDKKSFIIGDPKLEHTVTMVANLTCPPCANAYTKLIDVYRSSESFKIQFIFGAGKKDDLKIQLAAHLMSMCRSYSDEEILDALGNWYKHVEKGYNRWSKNYPAEITTSDYEHVNLQYYWSEIANVTHTPAFYINGSPLPTTYHVEELTYFL